MGKRLYHSLNDYLVSNPLTVDGQLNDGGGYLFPVKGREIEATVLFADISGFSRMTANLSSTETLVYVNTFFAWVTAEAIRHSTGIIDKYIGDEVMMVFSKEFGSDDPFEEAVVTARNMAEHDVHSYMPHMGISSGVVTIGYVGTPYCYNCSVFGSPVALAARCASVQPKIHPAMCSSWMTFPASEWGDRELSVVLPQEKLMYPDGTIEVRDLHWEISEKKSVDFNNLGTTEVRQILNRLMYIPSESPQDRAQSGMEALKEQGRYWPAK